MDAQTTNSSKPKPNVICIDSGRLRFAQQQTAATEGAKPRDRWTGWRNFALALAQQRCASCFGFGHRVGRNGANVVCNCVFRAIFVMCLGRFRACLDGSAPIGRVDLMSSMSHGKNQVATKAYALRHQEYVADFELLAFRTLNGGKTREQLAEAAVDTSLHWKLFALHMLLEAPWAVCCRKLGIDRGTFFHQVYRIQAVLGLAFADTEPHALFPLDEYFSPIVKRRSPAFISEPVTVTPPARRYCA